MRIVIDMQGAQSESRFRGIGRYTMSLALAIAKNAGEHEIWLALNAALPESIPDIRKAFDSLIPQERICVFEIPLPVAEENPENSSRARVAELIREYFLSQLSPDVVLITSLFEGYVDNAVTSVGKLDTKYKTAVILYDLIPYLNPEQYLHLKNQYDYYMRKIDSLKNADLLLSISESSQKEGSQALDIDEAKVYNISTAVDDRFCSLNLNVHDAQALHYKYGITRKMIMYAPGGFDVRKNFDGLIEAYSLLPQTLRDEYQLVIVSKGDRQNLNSMAKKVGLKDDELIVTGYVSDEDLVALYNTATLFVFPSKHEGFGLPALEAMACGTPVIGSNTTSIPEVIGVEEALFNPESPESMANKMQQVLTNDALKNKILSEEQKYIKQFSWDLSAQKALFALDNLFHRPTISKKNFLPVSELYHQLIDNVSQYPLSETDVLDIARCIANNTHSKSKPTVYIDVTQIYMQDFGTGIQRVVNSIVSEIYKLQLTSHNVVLVYLENNIGRWQYRRASKFENKFKNTPLETNGDIIEPTNGDIFLGLDLMSWIVDAQKQGLFTTWKNRGVQISFIVYDILPILHPEWWPGDGEKIHQEWLSTILDISDNVISISNAVSDEVRIWAEQNSKSAIPKLTYFHLGADIKHTHPNKNNNLSNIQRRLCNDIQSRVSFLMVGTLEPRKGHMQTVEAFEKLWEKNIDVNLIIVGKMGWLVDDLVKKLKNHPELNKRLFWLEGISDAYLEEIYSASTCLIAASGGEGFGLPLIEAAQKKKPIIARDIPVFREVAGEYAYYFKNSKDPQVLAEAIKEWLDLYKEGKHPKSDNMPWLTWEESTQQLLSKIRILNNT